MELWVDKYRPMSVKDYAFVDKEQENTISKWIADGSTPHLLLSGTAGVGKTSLAKLLMNEMKVDPRDVLEINASMDNGIDIIRDKIHSFASSMAWGNGFKYVILDEADYLTIPAQMPLRNLMEKFQSYVRYILTCNDVDKIDNALKSRCEHFHITQVNKEQFCMRAINILTSENIKFDDETLVSFIDKTYPDMRDCIKKLQSNSYDGELHPMGNSSSMKDDILEEIKNLFHSKKYKEGRKFIIDNVHPSSYPDMYRLMYNNLDWWGDTDEQKSQAIVTIAEGVRWHHNCADPEINFSATLINLERIS